MSLHARVRAKAFESTETLDSGHDVRKGLAEVLEHGEVVSRIVAALITKENEEPAIQFSFGAARDLGISSQEFTLVGAAASVFLDLVEQLRDHFDRDGRAALTSDVTIRVDAGYGYSRGED